MQVTLYCSNNLLLQAWQLWNEGKSLELVDPKLERSSFLDEVTRCIHVGLLCVQDQATDRPTISNVVSMLTNESMVLPAPKQPAFFVGNTEVHEINLEDCSLNDVTISLLEVR